MQKHKGWKPTLNAVLKAHNKSASLGGKAVSFAAQVLRRETLEQCFKLLRELGYKLPDVKGFKERHLTALAHAWEAKGLSPSSIQNRISVFRVFAGPSTGELKADETELFPSKQTISVTFCHEQKR